ncbi:BamA/TamA family outer membrane protein [Pontiellaceae bacterium B12227]|nr:BamA/TamA family outer membrane protein [Pontiellaceae bacterium B12227]
MKSYPALHKFALLTAFIPILTTADTNTLHSSTDKEEKSWLVAPMVVANPAFGNGGGVMGMYFFNTEKSSTNNPASAIGAMGLYSDTDSYFMGIFAQTFWKQDTWRVTAGLVNPKIKNDFSIIEGLQNVKFDTTATVLFGRVDRRVYGNWFLGLKGELVDVKYSNPNTIAKAYFLLAEVEDATSGQLGAIASHDSRDHVRYPTAGNQSELSLTTVPESWGASSSYYITEGFANQYISFIDKQVLALRAFGRFTPSGTPYSGLSTLGRFSDLRGYTGGENVAENLVALQGEYRIRFTDKIGGVAFAGISQLYNGSFKNTDSDDLYPSGGLGFRYLLNAENKMNFRFDYAWGKGDDEGFYVSVGEAF